jgi:hypothetical protein
MATKGISKYAKHDKYILTHYRLKGPKALGIELEMPPNMVMYRYQLATGTLPIRAKRAQSPADASYTPITERETSITLPRITLDRDLK